MKTATSLLVLALAVALGACEAIQLGKLRPGASSAATVREQFGAPEAEWANPDGSVTWEYPRGPEGVRTWMLTLDKSSVLQSIEQVLTEENFARIEKGWSMAQVRRLLGKPSGMNRFARQSEEVWEWRVAPLQPINSAWFHVHFDLEGRVSRVSRREESPVGGPDQN